jgi:hypothetical protein
LAGGPASSIGDEERISFDHYIFFLKYVLEPGEVLGEKLFSGRRLSSTIIGNYDFAGLKRCKLQLLRSKAPKTPLFQRPPLHPELLVRQVPAVNLPVPWIRGFKNRRFSKLHSSKLHKWRHQQVTSHDICSHSSSAVPRIHWHGNFDDPESSRCLSYDVGFAASDHQISTVAQWLRMMVWTGQRISIQTLFLLMDGRERREADMGNRGERGKRPEQSPELAMFFEYTELKLQEGIRD